MMKSWLQKSFGSSSKHTKSASSPQRLSLLDDGSVHRGVSSPYGSNAGSLNTKRSSMGSTNISVRNPVERRSLPAMHLNERSVQDSCAMMDNPPVFDNPLRRRGCFDHKHTEQMSTYRQEAINRELNVKRHMRSTPLSDSEVA